MKHLDIAIPCLNAEHILPFSIYRLYSFASEYLHEYDWRIIISNNGSSDNTLRVASELAIKYERVTYISTSQRGKGIAIRNAWLHSCADILAYVDADLSIDVAALPDLISSVSNGECDIAVGSRFLPDSRVAGRKLLRKIASRSYILFLKLLHGIPFHDAQCGMKVISREVADNLILSVVDDEWFFDSELLVLAYRGGYRVKEIPVSMVDNTDASSVRLLSTSYKLMKAMLRFKLWIK